MKTQLALSLLVAAVLSSCTTVKTTPASANARNPESAAYAASSTVESQPLKESDVIAEGPADLEANPALLPSPLLRRSAASGL
jgi:hypothetical protein